MKKKFILSLVFTFLFLCVMAVTVGAEVLTQYCDVKITTTKNEELTCYMPVEIADDVPTFNRNTLYKTTDTSGGTLSWNQVLIFDMRETTYYGCDTAELVKGTNCNNYASKVKEVYLPEGLKKLPKNSFTSAWASLQTVYIPSSLEIIDERAFYQSKIVNVAFAENSNLLSIGKDAFRACPNIQTVDLPEGLETIGEYAFYGSGLSGRFVVPNSVTSIGTSTFRKTKIETIVFGDGDIELGATIIGDNSTNYNNHLKNVYLSVGTTFTSPTDTWFVSEGEIINFYVVSKGDVDTSEFVETLKQTGVLTFATEEEVEKNPMLSCSAIICESANMCDAFYKGVHIQPEGVELDFTDALSKFCEAQECVVCKSYLPVGNFYDPIIEFVGYSTRENGTGLCAEYKINKESYSKYTEYKDKLQFGVIVSIVEDINNINLVDIDAEGNVTPINSNKTAVSTVLDTYTGFSIKLSGFNANLTDLNVVLCAYAYDGEKISYLSNIATDVPQIIQVGQM